MNITVDEIEQHEDRLRQVMMKCECGLAALGVMRGYIEKGVAPKSIELAPLLSVFAPASAAVSLWQEAVAPLSSAPVPLPPPPSPIALPPKPPVEKYVNPELTPWQFSGHGSNARLVRWAIQRVRCDFSLNDIDAILECEGKSVARPEISVVLSRLRERGEIVEIKRGAGSIPTVYQNPHPPDEAQTAQVVAHCPSQP